MSSPDAESELFGVKSDSDPFAEVDSKSDPFGTDPPAKPQVNGRESASPEMFDLSRLAPPLSAPPTRVCRTPEAFLGPTGASLVNLDALIPSNPPSKTHNNPFLSGNKHLLKNSHAAHRNIIVKLLKTFPILSPQVWALRLPPTPSTATSLASPSTKCDHPPHPHCPPTCSPTARRCPSLCPTSHPSSPPLSHNLLPASWTFPPTSHSPCSPSPHDRRPALSHRHRHTATTPSSETAASFKLRPVDGDDRMDFLE